MRTGRRLLWLGAALIILAETCWSQRASNWRAYKVVDGLPEAACISVTFSPQNKVLARHFSQPLITELDGYGITNMPAPEGSKSRIYQSPGGQLWSVAAQGLDEFSFKTRTWISHHVQEIAAPHRGLAPLIDPIPLRPVRQGLVIFLLPERLMQFNNEDANRPQTTLLRSSAQTRLGEFSGMGNAHDGGLWIAGSHGLAKIPPPVRSLTPETEWREYLVPAELHIENLQAPHEDEDGGVTMIAESTTNHQKLVLYFDGKSWQASAPVAEKLRQAWRAGDRTWWAMALDALYRWREDQSGLTEIDEVSAREYFDVAIEPGGAFWLATSDGLIRYAPSLWRSPGSLHLQNAQVRCLAADRQSGLWFVAGGRLHHLQDFTLEEFPLSTERAARALYPLKNGALVLETEPAESGKPGALFTLDPGQRRFNRLDEGGRPAGLKALGLLPDGSLCLEVFGDGSSKSNCELKRFDGTRYEACPEPPPALGTNWETLFVAQNGDWWIGSELGTACYHDKAWRCFTAADESLPAAPVAFTELADGKIWCATETQVWESDGNSWQLVRGGFGRINSLVRSRRDGSIWVGASSGVHRLMQGVWIENGIEDGLPAASVRQICEDPRGQLWAATTRGLSQFHPEADPDPPRGFIEPLSDAGNDVPEGRTISLRFAAADKWKYTSPERLLFSYRMDGRDWSAFQEAGRVSFPDLAPGKHYFEVRPLDRNGNRGEAVQLEFAILLPWYRESRLVLISAAGAAAALFFAGLALKRHRQLVRSYAEVERKVAERTQQLEVAGRELLHSQKMNALGALAAGIAHDFNNILSIIKGSAQIIEDNVENPDKIRIRTDRIRTVVEQGSGIVKAMLGFSRETNERPAPCELNAAVEDTLKLLGDRFLREVQVTFEPAPGLPAVVVSRDLIQQILLNFIFNAAESMTKQRQIIIRSTRLSALPPELVLAPASAPAYLAISVQDFGCGISPENLPRIFEPFFTTKALSTHRGTGLGLSMVYELAKKLSSGLAVVSVLDQGSTFTLIVPVAAGEQREKDEPGSI